MVIEESRLLNAGNTVPKRTGKVLIWLIVTVVGLFLPMVLDYVSISLSKFLDGSKTDKGTMLMLRILLSVGIPLLLTFVFAASINDKVIKKDGVTLLFQALLVIPYFLIMLPLLAFAVYSVALSGNADAASFIIRVCIALVSIPVIAIVLAIAAYLAAINRNKEIAPAYHAATIVIPAWVIQIVCVWVIRGF